MSKDDEYIMQLEDLLKNKGKSKKYIKICTKYAKRILENGLPVIFDLKHLSLLIGIETSQITKMMFSEELYYKEYCIPKKNGGKRVLDIPALQLKYIQRWILHNILNNIKISEYATGFCKNKSIVDNAKCHLNSECIINMDMKDFFPSIDFNKIFRVFAYYGYTNEVSYMLAKLCTYQGKLPQGSPASPCLSNIICLKLDKRLSELAKKYEAHYTRYADDITFSGKRGIEKCRDIITQIVKNEEFSINEKKTRTLYKHQRQEVTGLVINNGKVRINKKYKKDLMQEIYYCNKFGVIEHMKKTNCNKAFYKEYLYGKALFINMIEPDVGEKIFNLLNKIEWDY